MIKFFTFLCLCIFGSFSLLPAQLCNGSLGDPIVHIDFGAGVGPGPALQPGVTTYPYVNIDCPRDGYYTLHNAITNCYGGSWFDIVEDHTIGDVNGYYMLVNASATPGDFFVHTIPGLCANTTYEFSAWILNILKPSACRSVGIDPDLTFTIETASGVILASHNSGNIAETNSVSWSQYGVFFKTPPNITTVVVRITNNAPGGCGNDLALDDITFRPCGPLVNATVQLNGNDSAEVCEDDNSSFLFTASYSGVYSTPAFQWQESTNQGVTWKNIASATTTNYQRPSSNTPGVFLYRMLIGEAMNFNTPQCRTASNIITIIIHPAPAIQITPAMAECYGANVILSATGGVTYTWTGPNGFTSVLQRPVLTGINFSNGGLYTVVVYSDKGCTSSGTTNLVVNPPVTAVVGPDVNICEGTFTNLSATGGTKYKWTPLKGLSADNIPNPVAQPTDSTLYSVIVYNEFGCTDTGRVAVNVWKKPVANAGPDKTTRSDIPVQLNGSARGTNVSYYWTPNPITNASSLQPMVNPPHTQTYTLHVVSALGCGVSTDDMILKVYEKIKVPNAFSPNGDGIHDTWNINSLEQLDECVIEVYNRYGQLVYRSRGYSNPWNGTRNGMPLPIGTYYYIIDPKIAIEPRLTGWVFILR